jgi:hypothetical protein
MTARKLSREFLTLVKSVTNKRARIVIDHILKYGHVTTEDLKNYGYEHPPRAVRDVREHGIPIEMYRVKGKDGKNIAAYRFGDPSRVRAGRLAGRKVFSKQFKQRLIGGFGCKCGICLEEYEDRYLQIDHRVPYEVGGDLDKSQPAAFMLLCGSCNRAKSWSCEHCVNWQQQKSPDVCKSCYWTSPEAYKHIALRRIRRLDIVWTEDEIRFYDALEKMAQNSKVSMPKYVKKVVARHVGP